MQPQTADAEFPDMKTHMQMWGRYTRLRFRGTVGVAALLIFIGWITGVI